MCRSRCQVLVLLAAAFLGAPAAALAQSTPPSPRLYVQFGFDKDLDSALAQQFLEALTKSLAKQDWKDPGTRKLLKSRLAEIQKKDLASRKAIKKILSEQNLPPELKREIQKSAPARSGSGSDQSPRPRSPTASPQTEPQESKHEEATPPAPGIDPPPGEDLVAQWAHDLLEEADSQGWGDLVKKSPALQEGLKELQQILEKGEAGQPLPSELGRWAGNLRPWQQKLPLLPELSWLNPRSLSLPKLPVLELHMPRVGSLPGVPRLHMHLPRLGGSPPSGQALAQGSIWLAVLGIVALGCWYLLRRKWTAAGQAADAARLGPWPVDPAQVRTPAELILAFEYLSLLKLGSAARSWNHRMIAAHLSSSESPARQAAEELAFLYEQARYAPPADPWPDEAVAAARRALCFFAGAALA